MEFDNQVMKWFYIYKSGHYNIIIFVFLKFEIYLKNNVVWKLLHSETTQPQDIHNISGSGVAGVPAARRGS